MTTTLPTNGCADTSKDCTHTYRDGSVDCTFLLPDGGIAWLHILSAQMGQSLGDGKDKDVPGQSWTRSPRTFYSWVLSSLVSVSPVTLFPFGSSTPSLGPRLLAVPNHCSHSSDFTTNPISKELCSQDQSEGDFGCIPAKLLGNEGSFVRSPTSVIFFIGEML